MRTPRDTLGESVKYYFPTPLYLKKTPEEKPYVAYVTVLDTSEEKNFKLDL